MDAPRIYFDPHFTRDPDTRTGLPRATQTKTTVELGQSSCHACNRASYFLCETMHEGVEAAEQQKDTNSFSMAYVCFLKYRVPVCCRDWFFTLATRRFISKSTVKLSLRAAGFEHFVSKSKPPVLVVASLSTMYRRKRVICCSLPRASRTPRFRKVLKIRGGDLSFGAPTVVFYLACVDVC